jgi:hypothetical protein
MSFTEKPLNALLPFNMELLLTTKCEPAPQKHGYVPAGAGSIAVYRARLQAAFAS